MNTARVFAYVMLLGAWEITQRPITTETAEQGARRGRIADAIDTLEVLLTDEEISAANESAP